MATRIPTTSRRALLASAPALLLAGAVPAGAAEADDAKLIATCSAFDRLERRIKALCDGPDAIESDVELERQRDLLLDEQDLLFDQICALRAQTVEGFRARARSFVLYKEESPDWENSPYWSDRMLSVLIRDLAA